MTGRTMAGTTVNPAEKAARKALKLAPKEARSDFRVALGAASNAFLLERRGDRRARRPGAGKSCAPRPTRRIIAAKQAYHDAVAGLDGERVDAAIDLAVIATSAR